MIKAIIIDDEPNCIEALQEDLKMFCPEVMVADACCSAKEGILSIKKNRPDLIFLDVEMPWMNGFEMLEILDKEICFQTIFITAYDQFATRAFRVSAVDYLLKPVDGEALTEAIAKVKKALSDKEGSANIPNLLQNLKAPAEQQRIAVPNWDGFEFIPVNEIIYCKANGTYTSFILINNKSVILSRPLGEAEEMLPKVLFERIHHSLIVNIQHIRQYRKSAGFSIIMNNGEELSVAKSKKDQLLLRLGIK